MESWEHEADRDGKERVRKVLADALSPLHAGLYDLEPALDGVFTSKEVELARSDHKKAPKGLADDFRELKSRRVALLKLLMNEELRVIFSYIDAHEEEELPDRKIKRGSSWRWWASRYLETEYGLVKEGVWPHWYSLTTGRTGE